MAERYEMLPTSELTLEWLIEELRRIQASQPEVFEVVFLNGAPAKPREGMVVGADGTNWNPGGGKGVYAYYSGSWNKLG